DASQALLTALARKPAAVVLDIGLPDYDGTQFVARWRERRPDAGDVPIVIVSGRTDRKEIASLLGAAYVCGKPFIVDELVDQVERAVLHSARRIRVECCEPPGIRTRNQGIKSPLLYR